MWKIKTRHIRWIAGAVALAVALGGLAWGLSRVWERGALEAQAQTDTLLGIQALVAEKSAPGSQPYRILEIIPQGRIGGLSLLIGGQEDMGYRTAGPDGGLLPGGWKEQLATKTTPQARAEFMDQIKAQADRYLANMPGSGDAPFVWEPYQELDAAAAAADPASWSLEVGGNAAKGAFLAAAGGDWLPRFVRATKNLTVADINNRSTLTPVYMADKGAALTYGDVLGSGAFPLGDATPLYVESEGKFLSYAGTLGDLKALFASRGYVVSGGDAAVSGGDSAVSGGNAGSGSGTGGVYTGLPELGNLTEAVKSDLGELYYVPTFSVMAMDLAAPGGAGQQAVAAGPDTDAEYYTVDVANSHRLAAGQGMYTLVDTASTAGYLYDSFVLDSFTVYCKGGLVNNEWFKRQVLGLENQDEFGAFPIEVHTYSLQALENAMGRDKVSKDTALAFAAGFDMVYMGLGLDADPAPGIGLSEDAAFRAAMDIDATVLSNQPLLAILAHVLEGEIPVILDRGVYAQKSGSGNWALREYVARNTAVVPKYSQWTTLALLLAENRADKGVYLDLSNSSATNPLEGSGFAGVSTSNTNYIFNNIKNYDRGAAYTVSASTGAADMAFAYTSVWSLGERYLLQKGGLGDFFDPAPPADAFVTKGGFLDVTVALSNENYARKQKAALASGSDSLAVLLEERASNAAVWRHIVDYARRRGNVKKTSLRVLEVQPSFSRYLLSSPAGIAEADGTVYPERNSAWSRLPYNVAAWTGVQTNKIVIDQVSISEFIGMTEDLASKYDLVYFGDGLNGLHYTNLGGGSFITNYTENALDGLLYTHVGDRVETAASINGLLRTDFTLVRKGSWAAPLNGESGVVSGASVAFYPQSNGVWGLKATVPHRYSGTDLTLEMFNALVDLLEAGYPIVTADVLWKEVGGQLEVNDERVDNSSYLYELLNLARPVAQGGRAYANIFRSSDVYPEGARRDIFNYYVNRTKLDLVEQEVSSGGQTRKTKVTLVDGDGQVLAKYQSDGKVNPYVDVLPRHRDGLYYLDLRFTIENRGQVSAADRYGLRLHVDTNGDGKFSDKTEALDGLRVLDQAGNAVELTQLQAGVPYTLRRQVPESVQGAFTWNVEIYSPANEMIRHSTHGYVKLQDNAGTPFRILQVYATPADKTIDLQKSIGTYNRASGQYENREAVGSTSVAPYLGELADQLRGEFPLEIETISKGELESRLANGTLSGDYQMLILGFGLAQDGQADWNNDSMAYIKQFIQSGKNVLISHDIFSSINATKDRALALGMLEGYGDEFLPDVQNAEPLYSEFMLGDFTRFFSLSRDGSVWNDYGLVVPTGYQSGSSVNFQVVDDGNWGYHTNQQLRDLVGMDMYGIRQLSGPLETEFSDLSQMLEMGGGIPGGQLSAYAPARQADGLRYALGSKEIAYKARSGRSQTVPEVQGYSALTINVKGTQGNGYAYNGDTRWRVSKAYSLNGAGTASPTGVIGSAASTGGVTGLSILNDTAAQLGYRIRASLNNVVQRLPVNTIEAVNVGQISSYPYNLNDVTDPTGLNVDTEIVQHYIMEHFHFLYGDRVSGARGPRVSRGVNFAIGASSQPYYALDLNADKDQDGHGDLVVWYTLARQAGYRGSPNDVRNNYYLYTKGNITYMGMGYGVTKGMDQSITRNEAKLFFNVLAAAYRAARQPAQVYLTDKTGQPQEVVYNYYDATLGFEDIAVNAQSEAAGKSRVYFRVEDGNLHLGPATVQVELYVAVPATESGAVALRWGSLPGGAFQNNYHGRRVTAPVYKAAGDVIQAPNGDGSYSLQTATLYYVDVPSSELTAGGSPDQGKNVGEVILRGRTYFPQDAGQVDQIAWEYSRMTFVNVELFDLD